jgi:hypothetical protein
MSRTIVFVFAMMATTVFAAPGAMIKDDALRASASGDSRIVGRVAKGDKVEVLQRRGGWTQISQDGKTGWVRILSVRTANRGASVFGGLMQMSTAQREPRKVVAVAGLRGLSEDASATGRSLTLENLQAARFNAQELSLLERYASNRNDAERFAGSVGLDSLDLAYLPAMQQEAETTGSGFVWGEGL